MDSNQQYLKTLHAENVEWSKSLGFYSDELKSFELRLSEVVIANTGTEVLSQVEHFQNQFIRQREVIDILNHEMNVGEDKILEEVKNNDVATDHRKMEDHSELRDQMQAFEKIYREMKAEFIEYLSKVL
jgi:ABC-type uncharacterized transport system ATPase subunit